MSGTKTSRADLKNRFKKGMYPTEGDFANVFESYLHKDDDISMSKVVLTDGDGNTTTLNNVIGNKADKTDLTEITNRLTTAENDIDTAEDNIAGHETRIQGLEAFKERVRAFLEDADASEETINRWHEIESFLQGITDTQTLTGLLNNLKQEILQSIPQSQQGNYLQLIDDLDAYTDAPVGTIVKYTGPTNAKYTHGFDYEKVGGDASEITVEAPFDGMNVVDSYIDTIESQAFYPTGRTKVQQKYSDGISANYWLSLSDDGTLSEGDTLYRMTNNFNGTPEQATVTGTNGNAYSFDNGLTMSKLGSPVAVNEYVAQDGKLLYAESRSAMNLPCWYVTDSSKLFAYSHVSLFHSDEDAHITVGSPDSWQPSKSMSVID